MKCTFLQNCETTADCQAKDGGDPDVQFVCIPLTCCGDSRKKCMKCCGNPFTDHPTTELPSWTSTTSSYLPSTSTKPTTYEPTRYYSPSTTYQPHEYQTPRPTTYDTPRPSTPIDGQSPKPTCVPRPDWC